MDQELRRKAEKLFHAALEREPETRRAFLDSACEGDGDLQRQVESLLSQAEQGGSFPERPALEDVTTTLTSVQSLLGRQIGPYRIVSPLGAGGMGEVYRAHDPRLHRDVAIKVSATRFGERIEREAKAIAALNHPNICQIYDIGPSYLVIELIQGETLRDYLKKARSEGRTLEIARQVLEALRAAHAAGIIHRDLKPANIMVRSDGYVKVLDFGLAKRIPISGALDTTGTVGPSVPGQILGTVAYMSPEQILGQEIDQRSDLFAFGIILCEMVTGRHPWPRKSQVDTLHAILHDDPPPIQADFAGVVNRLLCKNREERYSSAEAVLDELASPAPPQTPPRRGLTRLIVLPFRLLRRHEASDFLSVSLPDAITNSLAAIDSLVVRSTMAASRFAASPDLEVSAIAEQAQVDAILTGTILSDGEHLRVTTQLVEAPSGTVLWSNTSQVSLRDIFQLQDELVDRIIQSLKLPLTAREERALKHDAPASALGYEFYLRANQLAFTSFDGPNWVLARDLYLRSVEADPKYAPAWAGLGRTYHVIGKYGVDDLAENLARADDAFKKAFRLNPELTLAHNFYTSFETDSGRSLEAMARLLNRVQAHRNDPILLAGLVYACRYCGLLEASLAAHDLARRLDPHARTTVLYVYLDLGDYQRVIDSCDSRDRAIAVQALIALSRKQEAIAYCLELERTIPLKQLKLFAGAVRASLEGACEKSLEMLDRVLELSGPMVNDPESHYWIARELSSLNESERSLDFLSLALDRGYRCHYALLHDPRLDSLRSHRRFPELVNRAAALDLEARAVFLDNGGDRLLGVQLGRPPQPHASN